MRFEDFKKDGEAIKEMEKPSKKNVKREDAKGEKSDEKNEDKPREKGRFEFVLYINDLPVCRRNFRNDGYIEKSVYTKQFKQEIDRIVELIDNDLKSKSRVYTWYNYYHGLYDVKNGRFVPNTTNEAEYPRYVSEEFLQPLPKEGEIVFKFAVYDNGKEVISKIWDGRYYPAWVRNNIDLTNRQVKITTKDGKVIICDKDKYFTDNDRSMPGDVYILRSMIIDKEDLALQIQKFIYETTSSYDGYYEKLSDYTTSETFTNTDYVRDENGNIVYREDGTPRFKNLPGSKNYCYDLYKVNKIYESAWGAVLADKTRAYFDSLYVKPESPRKVKRPSE